MAFDEKSNNNYKILGEGAYGVVFRPSFKNEGDEKNDPSPDNVTKLFYEKENYNNILRKRNILSTVFPKNQLFRPYRRTMKAKNLPRRIKNATWFENDSNVWMVHMPYLGKSLKELFIMDKEYAYFETIRHIPIWRILEQITILLSTTAKLAGIQHVHGDIHLGNIMFRMEDATMYLIDFDHFRPYMEYYKYKQLQFAEEYDPPEGLFLPKMSSLLSSLQVPVVYPISRPNAYESFYPTKKNINTIEEKRGVVTYTESVYHLLHKTYPLVWEYMNYKTKQRLFIKIQKSIKDNAKYISKRMKDDTWENVLIKYVLPYYDNYRLGISLAEFLLKLYGPLPGEGNEDLFLDTMEHSNQLPPHPKNYEHFTTRTVNILHETIQLLLNMSSFTLSDRPNPDVAYEAMNAIYVNYIAEMKTVGLNQHNKKSNRRNTRKK